MIMNGDMRVQQRASTGGTWVTTRYGYVTDRFAGYQVTLSYKYKKSLICLVSLGL